MRWKRVEPYGPGLRRRGRGRGFSYLRDGVPVTDARTLERVKALVIPPAWREVWICEDPCGVIQAVGVDAAGRRQYLYHPKWREERDAEKHDRVLALSARLPAVRRAVTRDLRSPGATRRRALAAALRVADTGVRTGGEEYADDEGGYGVATMLREHARIGRETVSFAYPGKAGVHQETVLRDPDLARALRAMRGGDRLFTWREAGEWRELRAADLNDRFRELAGDGYTVKDLRTWRATVVAARALASGADEKEAVAAVAEDLGNTPAVARASYIDPRVLAAGRNGRTIPRGGGDRAVRELIEREARS